MSNSNRKVGIISIQEDVQQIIYKPRQLRKYAPELLALCEYLISPTSYLDVVMPEDKKERLSQLLAQIIVESTTSGNQEKQLPRSIGIIWAIEDVQAVRPDLTDEQAAHVLEQVKQGHDASIGINWGVLEIVADIEFGSREESDNEEE